MNWKTSDQLRDELMNYFLLCEEAGYPAHRIHNFHGFVVKEQAVIDAIDREAGEYDDDDYDDRD